MKVNWHVAGMLVLQVVFFVSIWLTMSPAFSYTPGPLTFRDIVIPIVLLVGSYKIAKRAGSFLMSAIIVAACSKEELEKKYGITY